MSKAPINRTDIHVDKDVTGEKIIWSHTVDIGNAVEDAKAWRVQLENTSSYGEEMRPLMTIPEILIEKFCQDRGISWAEFHHPEEGKKHVRALLADPALAAFRLRSSGY